MSIAKKINIFLALFFVITMVFTTLIMGYYFLPHGDHGEETTFRVENKDTLRHIAGKLFVEDYIILPELYMLITKLSGNGRALRAGEFTLPPNPSPYRINSVLTKGVSKLYSITLIEGKEVADYILALKNAGFKHDSDVASLIKKYHGKQGWLAPNTYHYPKNSSIETVLQDVEAKQRQLLDQHWQARAKGLPYKNAEQALIMASMIEKESGNLAEKPLIAGVFINRLKLRMRLQSDPTVIYGVTDYNNRKNYVIKKSDLKNNNPYNTYVNYGLPPKPICNPSESAIRAALNPQETTYLYFVAKPIDLGEKGHNFATTIHEHNRNVALYRKSLKR